MRAHSNDQKYFLIIQAIIGWIAVLLQFYLLIKNRRLDVLPTIIQFFSYFTILTNLLVALYATVLVIDPGSNLKKWFSKASVATAIAVYITIVGIVYNVVLRFLWDPQGLQKIVDEALHTIIPIMCIIYWVLWISKKELKWKATFPWLLYPLVYFVYILIRGALSSLYPYPFMDVLILGYPKVILNSVVLTIVFLGVGLLYVGIAKLITTRQIQPPKT